MSQLEQQLGDWAKAAEKLIESKTQELCDARVQNFERCALEGQQGPGGQWTKEVLNSVLDAARASCKWSIPPGPLDCPVSRPCSE